VVGFIGLEQDTEIATVYVATAKRDIQAGEVELP
jgi:hypothetical protein